MVAKRRAQQRGKSFSARNQRDLTREKVIEASLILVDRTGAATITMRGVADAVGVTPMALYNYFSSKRDLLRAVAEHVIDNAEFDSRHTDWHQQIKHCFRVLRTICLRHPGLPALLETQGAAPASVFAPMEVTLRAFEEAGFDTIDSLRTYFMLVGFTLAQASYETRGPFPDLEPSEKVRAERITGRGYRVTEHLKLPDKWDFEGSFEFGLALILTGVEGMAGSSRALPQSRNDRRKNPRQAEAVNPLTS